MAIKFILRSTAFVTSAIRNSWRFPLFTQFRSMTTSQYFGSSHNCCVTIFNSAIEAVLPDRMIQKHVVFSEKDNLLTVAEKSFKVNKNVYIIGFGKAVCGMAAAVDVLLEKNIVKGILSIPFGMQQTLKNSGKRSHFFVTISWSHGCYKANKNRHRSASWSTKDLQRSVMRLQ
uniref:MOFRL-associated domain-containing protein n=1 Tax=Octopus bimaculoides TaxID=37653 RepID=A0A0L8I648_OCTBM